MASLVLELELIQTQMAQKPMLRAEVRSVRACDARKSLVIVSNLFNHRDKNYPDAATFL